MPPRALTEKKEENEQKFDIVIFKENFNEIITYRFSWFQWASSVVSSSSESELSGQLWFV